LFLDIDREVELLASLLTVKDLNLSPTKGYQGDHLYVRGYIEDKEDFNEHRYYHEMLKPAIESLAQLLNNVQYAEFEEFPCMDLKSTGTPQISGGGEEYGFWIRKTTSYNMFGDLNPCPEHVATEEFDGHYGSDDLDNCPEDCTHDSTPRFGPGYETIYDVLVRTYPKMQIK
jgi:hypothetical protein